MGLRKALLEHKQRSVWCEATQPHQWGAESQPGISHIPSLGDCWEKFN